MDEVEVEGPTQDPEAEVEGVPGVAEPRGSGYEEAERRWEWDVANLRDLRARRDHLNDLIRDAVRDEDLSRRAFAIYAKAVEGS